mmetsp:Transcript_16429/g.20311  ORF Transcript_16429/g.20311 Transcript_16429/m.20311 type:complete len:146 (-) Transcript_16429:211-648(-)|eukprot:CAMPEP_0204823178 /NCGR_PEP_ID=MMETSP1346-20131115/1281_1 /ASSEMBLY_ACC=CAM_ASM_000771 /TAXON_ID=215587 /ORGANISM="Aplanochytrium stocchinoi, Strain GSBS06" /LENGTH=145 /DNA_ID=CAMNT_0051949725 /DNA_START=158 /DNA_END=595 /DNA_ORIENTATION=-
MKRVAVRAGRTLNLATRSSVRVQATRRLSTALVNRSQGISLRPQFKNNLLIQQPVRNFAASTFLPVEEVTERVMNVVKAFEKVDEGKVTPTSHFANDLGLDSLDAVEVVMAFEEEFVIEIPDAEAEKILTCEDAIKFISAHPQAK